MAKIEIPHTFQIDRNYYLRASMIEQNSYQVAVTQPEGGSITVNGELGSRFSFWQGESVTIACTAQSGYTDPVLVVNGRPVANPYTVEITEDLTVTGTVSLITHTVTVSQPTGGSITVNGQAGSSFTLTLGAQATVQLTPQTGYNATSLLVNGTNVPNPHTFTLERNTAVTGIATIKTYTMTVSQPAGGTLTVNGNAAATQTYNHGTNLTVQVAANAGYQVSSLTVNGVARTNPFTFAITGNSTASAALAMAVPTGSVTLTTPSNFTVPVHIQVIQVKFDGGTSYVRVTPNKTYNLDIVLVKGAVAAIRNSVTKIAWLEVNIFTFTSKDRRYTISWSPAINNVAPNAIDL